MSYDMPTFPDIPRHPPTSSDMSDKQGSRLRFDQTRGAVLTEPYDTVYSKLRKPQVRRRFGRRLKRRLKRGLKRSRLKLRYCPRGGPFAGVEAESASTPANGQHRSAWPVAKRVH